ncbi:MAG: hypothetical protein LC795_03540 [Acidobacteria bacterium]|nr:hypothetical protein [Acidobacteriota bacterium]
MSNTKCPHCGLVNWETPETCERCGLPINSGATEASVLEAGAPEANVPEASAPEASAPRPARPDLPLLTLGSDVTTGSRTWKLMLAAVFAVTLGGAGWAIYKLRAEPRGGMFGSMRKQLAPPTHDERTRDALLAYLAQPGFAGTKVGGQVLGHAKLELLHVPAREVYFSAPAPELSGETFETMAARFVVDQKRLVLGQDDGTGRLRLGDYSLRRSDDKHFFFKTPVDNVKFDTATVLKFPYGPATYTLDMREMQDFVQNKSIFGGRMNARTGESREGLPVVFANHGALVARPDEPSLRRFVEELTRDIPADAEGARELRVQRVLDFVSREITYNQREATYSFELLKRPNEVLMSGESDCSNKAILLGSLLEQLGEDYLFVYTPGHITVAVPQGGFTARNGLWLEWDGQAWLIAEGTAPGFRIGLDRLRDEARLKQFQHVQRPRDRDVIYDVATRRQLLFQ